MWHTRLVPLKFQLSDVTLFSAHLCLQEREVGLADDVPSIAIPEPPEDPLPSGCHGFLIRSLPVQRPQPTLRRLPGYYCYVPSQYERYSIDLRQSFAEYARKFSSKTRSTITRKIRRFSDHCGGAIAWTVYRTPEELAEFYLLARLLSARTYQERLLDAGLPEEDSFRSAMLARAAEGQVRAYMLFDGTRPVAYLYCPVANGALLYEHLGYDPAYREWSVGTILQWYALQNMFAEKSFDLFDFTEGQGEQKRFFSTHSVLCANVYFLRRTPRCATLIHAHRAMSALSAGSGRLLDRFNLRSRVRALIRFRSRATS